MTTKNETVDEEPTDYVLDKLNSKLDDFKVAREELEELETEELKSLVASLHEDLSELKFDEYTVYSTARSILFNRDVDVTEVVT